MIITTLQNAAAATVASLPPANAVDASTGVTRVDQTGTPAYVWQYGEEQPYRRDDAYVFAATRSLRQGGIHPVMAVVLAPATLVFDAVFFPFAVALDSFASAP